MEGFMVGGTYGSYAELHGPCGRGTWGPRVWPVGCYMEGTWGLCGEHMWGMWSGGVHMGRTWGAFGDAMGRGSSAPCIRAPGRGIGPVRAGMRMGQEAAEPRPRPQAAQSREACWAVFGSRPADCDREKILVFFSTRFGVACYQVVRVEHVV